MCMLCRVTAMRPIFAAEFFNRTNPSRLNHLNVTVPYSWAELTCRIRYSIYDFGSQVVILGQTGNLTSLCDVQLRAGRS